MARQALHPPLLEVPASVDELANLRAHVRRGAGQLGASPAATSDLVQAVDELATNAIVHGYRGRPGSVRVELLVDGRDLIIRLADSAPPFDPTTVPTPDLDVPLRARRGGGMGVHLARQMTDELRYRRTTAGNELTLIKRDAIKREADHVEHRS